MTDPTEQVAKRLDLPPRVVELAVEALMVEAQMARADPASFFDFAMREETTLAALTVMPHQRVLFDFVVAHPRCVVRMPAGSSKTFCMATLTLWLLGQDVTVRGAIVSATQKQAMKPLKMVADYVTQDMLAAHVRLAFPHLKKSARTHDPWTQTAITVDRPPGIRDPSLVAIGTDGALPGSRLAWIIIDDILDRQNTATPAQRETTLEFIDSTVLSRLDPDDARCVFTNTPWHPDDASYRLERAGWPTLTMDIMGGIKLTNVGPEWDTDDIRPSREPGERYRLSEHDPDATEDVPLWPQRFSREFIDLELRKRHLSHEFNRLFMCRCRDEEQARCKIEWVEKCKRRDIQLVSRYEGHNMTVTGVDLGVGLQDKHDKTAFVTLELMPTGKRRILDVEMGRFDGPTIVAKIIRKQRAYNSIVRVENNAAQAYIKQFTLATNASVPVKPHTTGKNKADPRFGVESIFVELSNGAWEIPCDRLGRCHKQVQELIDGWLYYEPGKHTHDAVMAAWFAREQARALGDGRLLGEGQGRTGHGSIGMNIMSR